MKKILIISNDKFDDVINLVGSEAMRIKSHCENIFNDYEIDIYTENLKKTIKKGRIAYLAMNRDSLLENMSSYGVVLLFQNSHFSSFAYQIARKKLLVKIIIDLYNPLILEKATYSSEERMRETIETTTKIIASGDYFFCANQTQKNYYFGFLTMLGKMKNRKQEDQNISIIPTILSQKKTKEDNSVKTKDFLFFGGAYPWFDIEEINRFSKKIIEAGKNITFFGYKNPSVKGNFLKIANNVYENNNLKNKTQVFFVDWLPYEKIQTEIKKYKIAFNFVQNTTEDIFSYRTRLLSLLQNGIPVITNGNDEISRLIIEKNAGYQYQKEKDLVSYLISLEKKSENSYALFNSLNRIEKQEKNKIVEFIKRNIILGKNGINADEIYKKIIFLIRQYIT